jgi:hypothetical protein
VKSISKFAIALSMTTLPLFAQESSVANSISVAFKTVKREVISMNIPIVDSLKNEKFWEIYDDYEAALTKENKKYLELIKEYASSMETITEKDADKAVKALLKMKSNRIKILKKTHKKLASEVSSIEAARFIQIDNRIRLLLDLKIASALPMLLPEGVTVTAEGAIVKIPAK